MRPWNHVHRNELPHASRRGGSRVGCGFDRTHVAADENRYIPGADVLLADKHDVRGLDHCVGGFDRSDQASRFHHAERFRCHQCDGTLTELRSIIPLSMPRVFSSGLYLCALTLLLLTAGCRRTQQTDTPIITPTVTLARLDAAIAMPIEMNYRFIMAANAP